MPIIKSAKKALRSAKHKKVFNDRRRRAMRDSIKEVKAKVADKSIETGVKALALAYKAIDKAAKRGVIKKNTAARKKARLTALAKKAAGK